jgi:hypothetical protein
VIKFNRPFSLGRLNCLTFEANSLIASKLLAVGENFLKYFDIGEELIRIHFELIKKLS